MDIKEISSNSLSFIGDAVFTLRVREYFVTHKYQSSKSLQKLCNGVDVEVSLRGGLQQALGILVIDHLNLSYAVSAGCAEADGILSYIDSCFC